MMEGYVYLINAGEYFKIGITKNSIEKRMNQLQTGAGEQLFLIDSYKSEKYRQIETVLHRNLSHYKVMNEWFNIPVDVRLNFKKLCEKIEHNLALISNPNYNG